MPSFCRTQGTHGSDPPGVVFGIGLSGNVPAGAAPRLLPDGSIRSLNIWHLTVLTFTIWVIGGALPGGVPGW